MGIKLLGGDCKGTLLKVPRAGTRPTSVLLRRRVFDANQFLNSRQFIDACCGSGAVGLEALSRGAKDCIFVESNKKSFKILKENIAKVMAGIEISRNGELPKIETFNIDFIKWIRGFKIDYKNWSLKKQKDTIFFIDPPYDSLNIYESVKNEFLLGPWYLGQLWVEFEESEEIDGGFWSLNDRPVRKTFKQGKSWIYIF